MGYGWLFPKQDQANLGVAAGWNKSREARAEIERLKQQLVGEGIVEPGPPISRVSGLVPVSGPLERPATERVLLCGDAAGQVDPLTGAGILHALRSGSLAGECAGGQTYEQRLTREHGGTFSRALARRKDLERSWDRELDEALIRAWRLETP